MLNISRKWKILIRPDKAFFSGDALEGKVMNYGCGNRKESTHIGVDINENANADYIIRPGTELPFPDNSFDTVISRFVLEHVHDLDNLMSEVSRVLKPGGVFRFCVPHAFSVDSYDDPTHCRFFTLSTVKYYTGVSDVHYSGVQFNKYHAYLRLSLAWPRLRIIRHPFTFVLGSVSLMAPFFGEQLLKLPFITGTLYFELTKADCTGEFNEEETV